MDYLLMAASVGGGHLRAAQALKEALEDLRPEASALIFDYLGLTNPTLNRLARVSYGQMVNHAPVLWRGFYRATSRVKYDSPVQSVLYRGGLNCGAKFLEAFQPRAVVSTYPVPAGVFATLKHRGRTDALMVTVITDQAGHSQWIHPGTDLYLVGSHQVAEELRNLGVTAPIIVTGIPISPAFATAKKNGPSKARLGLNPELPLVLVMTGAEGMGQGLVQAIDLLGNFPEPLEAVVVTGQNNRLKDRLTSRLDSYTRPVTVLGFVDNVPELMAAADLMLGKAGGLTTSEALAVGLPMLVYRPIPGQEEANTRYLIKHGVGRAANNPLELKQELLLLLKKPELLLQMSSNCRSLGRPNAALEAIQWIERFLNIEAMEVI